MNATPMAAFPFRHPARLRAALIALAGALALAPACSHSLIGGDSKPNCAQLVARAFASPNVAVPGAFACLSPAVQAGGAKLSPPITNDASLAAFAATPPVFTAVQAKGSKFDTATQKLYYYFEFTPGPACWRAHLDSSGLVDSGAWKNGPCLPLP